MSSNQEPWYAELVSILAIMVTFVVLLSGFILLVKYARADKTCNGIENISPPVRQK